MDINPIDTHYNGLLFRSRLEARWAVFFDALGIKYRYEPEGYRLPNGMAYLPDFFLPEINGGIFAEVKWKIDDASLEKIAQLAAWTEKPVAVLENIPNPGDSADISVYYDEHSMDMGHEFCQCPKCGKTGLQFEARAARNCDCTDNDREYMGLQPQVEAAYDKVRKARFEYGENG